MINDILTTNWYEISVVAERAVFSLLTLFLVTKMIGNKQVSELSLFDYVISISIGNFAAEMTMNTDSQVLNGLTSLMIFGFIAIFVSIITMKSIFFRRVIIGTPTLLMQEGKILYKNLKKVKIDINDFLEVCRSQGYFDISEIKYAIMEVSGKVSFLLKEDYLPVNNKGLNIKNTSQGLCANIIIDGKIMKNNLKLVNKDLKWLEKELKQKGYNNTKNILLATVDINEKLVIYNKKEINFERNVLE